MATDDDDTFGEAIRKARSDLGLSLQAAADRLGMPKTTLWRLETQRMIETGGEEFDPTRYDRLVEQIFAGTHSTNRQPAPNIGA